ncbi:hypothetical protein BAUCODRAFT_246109 [Baudoinia panamericana UAMH 10762]|uniref:Uncharacterized protein n=1 Tax=Baudoinia panamericana (strain UAMH 10762) TaxID=717646 RepID=M2N4F2_BAUPA|nr:uncharacterized protein BAUCODRAFT_246109 [Baudoinia panamericana UAMH 10762]EMC93580.1 hypothetical protein BAUCODRAFT_246109 [Baudoinia panamericana UAMH 10762]
MSKMGRRAAFSTSNTSQTSPVTPDALAALSKEHDPAVAEGGQPHHSLHTYHDLITMSFGNGATGRSITVSGPEKDLFQHSDLSADEWWRGAAGCCKSRTLALHRYPTQGTLSLHLGNNSPLLGLLAYLLPASYSPKIMPK